MAGNPLVDKVLEYLSHTETVDTLQLAREWEEDHQRIIGAVKSIQSSGDIIQVEQRSEVRTELTAEGKEFVSKGSHEAILFAAVPSGGEGILLPELMKITGANGKIGMSKAMQAGWIKSVKEGNVNRVIRLKDNIEDKVQETLKKVTESNIELDAATMTDYKKRKLIVQNTVTYMVLRRAKGFTTVIEKPETDLTPEMIASGDWKTKNFKAYNFDALGTPLPAGHLHPLMKVRAEFRSVLFEMGFSEMPTNRFVESSFWNFDALFVPQKHPARDAQDTFFVSQPANCNSIPEDYMNKVKAAHEGGSYGSAGYGSNWKKEESVKNVLRTHTTAVSARMLYEIGQKAEFVPTKLFSIDRVFRNETLDATHLAEFHQVEGVVADRGINLGHLIGIMKEFFSRLGIKKLRFKPAYNPYTEPSMEVFAYHEGLKKWVEVGNSGMFRPEMLLPMGLPEDVKVIAWGLSLERPTMIRYGYDNIRDLVGPKVDLAMVYRSPICRLDKQLCGQTFDCSSVANVNDTTSQDTLMSINAAGQVRNSDKAKTRLQVIANHLALHTNKPSQNPEEKLQENMANENPLTSHILDTSRGRPAVGVLVKLFKRDVDGNWNLITEQSTNNDGRVGNLLPGAQFTPSVYKLYFDTKSYFLSKGEKTFYPFIEVVFEIERPEEHYHVPILLNAYGFSTYRGS